MTVTLLTTIIVIALFDSLNPSLFIAQLYLLTTPRPVPRILAYISGVLLANFLGGLLVLGGVRALFVDALQSIEPSVLYGAQLMLGVALVVFGLRMRIGPRAPTEARKPRSLGIGHAFLLGMVVMVNELTTALPYFVAIERLAQAELSPVWNVVALLIYNFVFGLPLFGFLAGYLATRQRFVAQIEQLNQRIAHWTPRIMKYASIGFGSLAIAHAVSYFALGDALVT